MDKTNQMHGESREQQNDTQSAPMQNGNTNDLDQPGATTATTAACTQAAPKAAATGHSRTTRSNIGSKKGSYWEEKGSDPGNRASEAA